MAGILAYDIVIATVHAAIETGLVNLVTAVISGRCLEIVWAEEYVFTRKIYSSDIGSYAVESFLLLNADRLCLIDENTGRSGNIGNVLPQYHK